MSHQIHVLHSSLRFKFPLVTSLDRRRTDSSPTNFPFSLSSKKIAVFRPLTIVRSHFSESDVNPKSVLGTSQDKSKPEKKANFGIFWIILINLGIYVADHFFKVRSIKSLYLYKDFPAWYQFVTATFCHTNWNHLSGNLFLLYIFGKIVEEEKGFVGLWLSYLFTGVGANLVSWLVSPPNAVSVGASGAVFGLFVISIMLKISPNWSSFLEFLILGQFVVKNVFEAAKGSAGLIERTFDGYDLLTIIQTVKPIAYFSGAFVGVFLVWLLTKFTSEHVDQDVKRSP